jgi:hypothetical protein
MTNKGRWRFFSSAGFSVLGLIFIACLGLRRRRVCRNFQRPPAACLGGTATMPDGNLWVTEAGINRIRMITPAASLPSSHWRLPLRGPFHYRRAGRRARLACHQQSEW